MNPKTPSKPAKVPPHRRVPLHVAIIMDGNGRWAGRRGLPRLAGHQAGTENVRRVVQAFAEQGVQYLTLFTFSTENWGRPNREVQGLLDILQEVIHRETEILHDQRVRLRHLGNLDRLPPKLRQEVRQAVELTKDNAGLTLSIAFDYGGRAEILAAVQRILQDGIPSEEVDAELFQRYLYTADLPDPDMIIRTAGEQRLSNFLLWQSAYSEYYWTPVPWPDFDETQVAQALQAYRQRQRRFGRLRPER